MKLFILIVLSFPSLLLAQTKPKTSKAPIVKQSFKPRTLEVGGVYKGGIIFELYEDGSGGKLFFQVAKEKFNTIQDALKDYSENGIKWSMADDYEVQKLLQLGLIGPDKGDGTWKHLWFMSARRMASYTYPYALTAEDILNLPTESNARIANIVQYASKIDRYEMKCYFAAVGIFSLRR